MAGQIKRKPDFERVLEAHKRARWGGPAMSRAAVLMNLNAAFDNFDDRCRAFFSSDPNIEDGPEGLAWEFVRPLGRGGFGAVGLWARIDKPQNDFCAVKDGSFISGDQYKGMPKGVVTEAVFQTQLNEFQGANNDILHLRRYKTYHHDASSLPSGAVAVEGDRIRMYFDYAPFRDLEFLRIAYRAWNRHLPELFIWHLLHSLARAVAVMNSDSWVKWEQNLNSDDIHIQKRKLRADVFLNHFDIKPQNIFLGKQTLEKDSSPHHTDWDPCADYPQILLGDFGLADLLTEDNLEQKYAGLPMRPPPNQGRCQRRDLPAPTPQVPHPQAPNPKDYWDEGGDVEQITGYGNGTAGFQPPEQVRMGSHWTDPPSKQEVIPSIGRTGARRPSFLAAQKEVYNNPNAKQVRFTDKSNIWAIGKVVFDLMMLEDGDFYMKCFAQLPREGSAQQAMYARVGGHMLSDQITSTTPQYSRTLRDLIKRCMSIDQSDRPTAEELLLDTQTGLDLLKTEVRSWPPAQRQEVRLYYKGSEINDMPMGQAAFQSTQAEYDELMMDTYRDTTQPPLNLPRAKFRTFKDTHERHRLLGVGRLFGAHTGPDGRTQYIPPQVGASRNKVVQVRLPINDERVQLTRASIEDATRKKLLPRGFTEQHLIDAEALQWLRRRQKGTDLSAEDEAVIAALQVFFGDRVGGSLSTGTAQRSPERIPTLEHLAILPPRPQADWLNSPVLRTNDVDSLLFQHDGTTPEVLNGLSETIEHRVWRQIREVGRQRFPRGQLIQETIRYIERIQTALSTSPDPAVNTVQRVELTEFLWNLRRRYKRMQLPGGREYTEVDERITNGLLTLRTDNLHNFLLMAEQFPELEVPDFSPISPEVTDMAGMAAALLAQLAAAAPVLPIVAPPIPVIPTLPLIAPPAPVLQSAAPVVALATPTKGGPRMLADGTIGAYCKHPCFTGVKANGNPCGHTTCCRNGVRPK